MFNLGLISKFRTELMGVATILIILAHMPANSVLMPSIVGKIIVHCGAGCDLFLFLSGLGVYKSFNQYYAAGGRGILGWYKKRLVRLLVPYFMICIPVFMWYAIQGHWTLWKYILRLSTLSFWSEGWGLWFLALIIVLYIFSPLLIKLLTGRRSGLWILLLISVTWLFSTIPTSQGIVHNILFCLCRVPCYLLGLYMADDILTNKEINLKYSGILLLFLFVICLCLNSKTGITISYIWIEGVINYCIRVDY